MSNEAVRLDWKALITFAEHLAVDTVEVGDANMRTGPEGAGNTRKAVRDSYSGEASRGYWRKTTALHFCHQVHFVHFCGWFGP
jgi:hypothetical protein